MPEGASTNRERPLRTLLTAAAVALACAAVVSASTVLLRPRQAEHRAAERRRAVEALVARLPGAAELFTQEDPPQVETRVIELATGHAVTAIDAAGFDAQKAALDPQLGLELTPAKDIASIQRRALYAVVHLVRHAGRLQMVVLPVYGSGYEGRIHGFVALAGDANTVVALSFHEHEETPGLGGEIDDAAWRAQWRGKRVRDDEGRLRIGVAEGRVPPGSPEAAYVADGISGATMTSQGVQALLRFWLGDDGFGPFLSILRAEGGSG